MGIFDKVKEVVGKIKEENQGFASTMKRINSSGFCGNVNRGIKNGDFWDGSYLSIEGDHGVIYGSNQADYTFGAGDIISFDCVDNLKVTASVGNQDHPARRFNIVFKDGKKAQADILLDKIDSVKSTLGLN